MTTRITGGFWRDRLDVNARRAIFHQWDQLEASGCIENFRIAAGEVEGFREGWFFADSDAHKWLDAASRILASFPSPELAAHIDAFISLLARAQQPDGYLFTYNQIHFPDTRWTNLQIEHELYCHGHLIEAGVSHYQATGRADLLEIVRRAADRIVEDFRGKDAKHTPGHEEIEIALLRLYQITRHQPYLEMARQFIEQRGRDPFFALSLLKQNFSVEARGKYVKQKKQEYLAAHPDFKPFQLPPGNVAKKPWNATLRWNINALSGKYFQQHAPVRKQTAPVGHSVRFAYLETAIAMLARETGDQTLVPALERAWERMATRRMYVTGGIGSLPAIEGFGNDYELDPEYAYAETCAALGSMLWNWEMAQLTGEAKYSDLFEWQLYNAAAVGMGMDGDAYLYNNPLACRGGVTRKPWYAVPCCPSNLSRAWADIGKYIFSSNQNELWIHQYISSQHETNFAKLELHSDLPWNGNVRIKIESPAEFPLHLRLPSWSESPQVKLNGEPIAQNAISLAPPARASMRSAQLRSVFLSLARAWSPADLLELTFDMPIQLRRAHPKVKGHADKVAISRGPLVYCLESADNPNVDIFNAKVNTASLRPTFDASILGGIMKIEARSADGQPLTFIPYHLWGNRGASTMTVWVNA
ncbi:MAG: Non-reducing end beta-L-arabinofuranosidase [Bryobacteraceae bacterium]|nr:Non-reducing end beta-L-arabinofuranosidase [Bryobacteraceae bacterium]